MVRRTLAALAMMLLTGGCLTSRIGPGVLRQDWNQRPRDPDPMRNPAAQEPDNRWTTNTPPRIPGPGEAQAPASGETEDVAGDEDSPAVDLARRWAATFLAWSLAGWLPLVEISGTFEEDPTTGNKRLKLDAGTAR